MNLVPKKTKPALKPKALWKRMQDPCRDCFGSGKVSKCSENHVGCLTCPTCNGSGVDTKPPLIYGPKDVAMVSKSVRASKVRQKPVQRARRPLRKRSKSMAKKMVQYNKQKAEYLKTHHWCDVLGQPFVAEDIHHSRGRAGSLLLDQRFWFAVSRKGHDLIHSRPEWARQAGYLCPVGHWNSIEMPNTQDLP